MIKTALTVNISNEDTQTNTFLINGSHLGLLSSADQNIHIQTSHKPIQILVAIHAEDLASDTNLARQRQKINAWQAFMPWLNRRGSGELNSLLQQYHLEPELLLCLDQTRLQAWLPEGKCLYVLRGGEVRRLRPITLRDTFFTESYHQSHQFYSLPVVLGDYFLMLPPELPPFFPGNELADLLLGLRQLPAKMSDILLTARQRGYQIESTWMALQVLRLDEDHVPGAESSSLRGLLTARRQPAGQSIDPESVTEAMSDEPGTDRPLKPAAGTLWPPSRTNWPVWLIIVLLTVGLTAGLTWFLGRETESEPTDSTTLQTTAPSASISPKASPTPAAPTPTVTPVPTEPEKILIVKARSLNLRDAPVRTGKLLTTLASGDRLVQLDDPAGDWVKVRTIDNLIGYVFYSYVEPEPAATTSR